MEDSLEKSGQGLIQQFSQDSQREDPTKGISHMPLSEKERKDPLLALKNLPGYITVAFGRIYQEKIREGGGLPDTSNPVMEAAAGQSEKSLGEAVWEGARKRAEKQIEFWRKMGVIIPEKSLPAVEKVLTVGYAGLNIVEASTLIVAGEGVYKKLLEAEKAGGVVDWAGGGSYETDGGDSGESGITVPRDEEQMAAEEGRITEAQQKNIDHLKEEVRKRAREKYIEEHGNDDGFEEWFKKWNS
ncbi:MAG: hypothetical protein N2558_03345 [Patescibacteria group bacterium]|nr:hypothetical protein [Patescibacteria group bacterium]